MTEEMRYTVSGEAQAQSRRWGMRVPSLRIVRQWLRDSLGFDSATSSDAKQAAKILRREWKEMKISNPGLQGFPTNRMVPVRAIRIKKSKSGQITGIDVLRDGPGPGARNPRPKAKKKTAKHRHTKPRTKTNRKKTVSRKRPVKKNSRKLKPGSRAWVKKMALARKRAARRKR